MKIPSKEFAKGVELCLNNATSLLEDAQLLANKGSYGHALFLVISAIEETSKAFIWSGGRIEIWKDKELYEDLVCHHQKYRLFVIMVFADAFASGVNRQIQTKEKKKPKPLQLEDLEELVRDLDNTVKEIWKSRLRGLYVDYQQGKWVSSSDIQREEVKELLQYATKYKKTMQSQCYNILRAPLDPAKQIQRYFEQELFPSISRRVQKNAEWLFNNGLIDEKLYKKLSSLKN
jgi:AbiV family abortive infection protein